MDTGHAGVERVATVDDITEAGFPHPGRLYDVDRYVTERASPFAETREVETTISVQHRQNFTEGPRGSKKRLYAGTRIDV